MLEGTLSKLRGLVKKALPIGIVYSLFHIVHPTFIPRLWYMIKDPFSSTTVEERMEKKFGFDYEGSSDEGEQLMLEDQLDKINEENPELLKHCKKVVLHANSTLESPFLKPFIYFLGRAWPFFDTVELCTFDIGTVAHELAHVKHFHATSDCDTKLDDIVDPEDYGKDLKPNWHFFINVPVEWSCGSTEPRKGFIRPYGANNRYENVATYVEKAFRAPSFWESEELQKSNKYVRVLDLLNKQGFVSKKQFEKIETTLKLNDPVWVDSKVEKALRKLQKPKLLKREEYEFLSELLYEDKNISVFYAAGGGYTGISVTVYLGSEKSKAFSYEWDDKKELQPWSIKFDKNPYQKTYDRIKTRLNELGYDKLGHFDDYVATLHPEWNCNRVTSLKK